MPSKFLSQIGGTYFRNNKGKTQGGKKNLKCFPSCSNTGHRRGFCGQVIAFHVDEAFGDIEQLHLFGRFGEYDQDGDFVVGQRYPAAHITVGTQVQMGDEKWWEGDRVQARRMFVFNRTARGWHYGCNMQSKANRAGLHSFKVYVFREIIKDQYECMEIVNSPTFRVLSQRWARKKIDETLQDTDARKIPTLEEQVLEKKHTAIPTNSHQIHVSSLRFGSDIDPDIATATLNLERIHSGCLPMTINSSTASFQQSLVNQSKLCIKAETHNNKKQQSREEPTKRKTETEECGQSIMLMLKNLHKRQKTSPPANLASRMSPPGDVPTRKAFGIEAMLNSM